MRRYAQLPQVSDDLEPHFLPFLNKPAFFNSADVFLSIPLEYIPSVGHHYPLAPFNSLSFS